MSKTRNYSKCFFGWLLCVFSGLGFVYIMFCIFFWINKPVAIVNEQYGIIAETWRILELIRWLSPRSESVETFVSKNSLGTWKNITFSTATNRKTVQFSKSLKATARRRNVIISSPPFNLALVDLVPLCTVGSRMPIPTCVNSESSYYESWIRESLLWTNQH